jgi:polysaccharide pyruvyl transferase WcaK-like protein
LRDYYSLNELKNYIVNRDDMNVIGDLSFMTSDDDIDNFKSLYSLSPCIGFNIGTSFGRIYGQDEDYVFKECVSLINRLTRDGYNVLFFPVWIKDIPIQNRIYLSCSNKKQLHIIEKIHDYRVIVSTLKKMDLVIGMKLHSTIFSFLAGVPVVSISYREKCLAFMEIMGMKKHAIKTDQHDLASNIYKSYLHILNNSELYKQKINKNLSKYREKSLKCINKLLSGI